MKELNADVYIKDLGKGRTEIQFNVNYRTKIGIMGFFMKPVMRKQFFPVLIGLKYYLETGGTVDKKNIKEIQDQYANGGRRFSFQPELNVA